jgi:serine protease Do
MNSPWLEELAASAADVAGQARRSLVAVEQRGRGTGSGIVWAPGWVVTNAHVVGSRRLRVRQGAAEGITAKVRAHDEGLDLAVLELEGEVGPAAVIGDSTALRPGVWVYAVGNPWGVAGGTTGGIVIDPKAGRDGGWLALGLHLRPGHSGGAVVNARGEVVGVNTMMNGPDVGLAISSSTVKGFLAQVGLGRPQSHLERAA